MVSKASESLRQMRIKKRPLDFTSNLERVESDGFRSRLQSSVSKEKCFRGEVKAPSMGRLFNEFNHEREECSRGVECNNGWVKQGLLKDGGDTGVFVKSKESNT